MQKLAENYFRKVIFKNFYEIDLNPVELSIADDSLKNKYVRGTLESLVLGLLALPALLFVDTATLSAVLIPVTMVSGSAWFSISLVSIKKKFEPFGGELTVDMYRSFLTSLTLLAFMIVTSMNPFLFSDISQLGRQIALIPIFSGVLGSLVVVKMIYDVFLGATKYDMNDSMLTGQNEAAQEFFTRSMSFSYQVTDLIRKEPNVVSTNYYISDGFSRLFNTVIMIKKDKNRNFSKAEDLNGLVLVVLRNPEMNQKEINQIFLSALLGFKELLNPNNKAARKIGYIDIEIECLKNNANENDRAKALRYATIFTLLYDIVTDEGQDIFL